MAENSEITVITESRNLRALPFSVTEDQLSTGKAWEDWLESLEREFRYFRITDASDRKDALIIYGGPEISRLEKSLPDPEDISLNLYEKLRTKLNNYFIPKRNTHYCRYMFLKMRPQAEDTTVAYATRLREKAHGCDFKTTQDERILEHLIQTIENQRLIQKCISKSWTLQEFLSEAAQIEAISEQVHEMKADPWSKKIAKVEERSRNWRSRNADICERGQTAEPCNYCGLSGVHNRGRNCPAYGVQCETCKKFDHFSSVCRRNMSPKDARYSLPMTHGHHHQKKVMKAEETYTSSESSDDEFLAQSIGHLRVKNVRKGNSLNVTQSIGIDIIQERVSQLEKELKAANELIQNLVAQQQNHQYHPLMQMDCKVLSFRDESGLQSQSDTNEKREIQELKTDAETFQKRNEMIIKPLVHSDGEVSETENHTQDQKLRIQPDDKQITDNMTRRRSRRRDRRH